IACQQVLVEDGSVFSVQWSVMPVAIAAGLSPLNLLERYLAYIKKCTFSIIRPLVLNTGLEFRLLNTGWSLISFLPPQAGAGFATLRICGGLLVQPRQCGCGEFRFELDTLPEGVRVSLRLSDFCPLILGSSSPSALRFRLYQLTQATIHRRVAVRFLAQLYRELAGVSAEIKIVNVSIRDGKAV
ncbi:MAG: hypothetical protein HY888_02145, partial [Deltaproteobacteria bacterium]|nr:hypothetical protein [Deltaproteobacteria bacterium]